MTDPENLRGFTGFWLPVDIINATELTWGQRLIWAEIHSLQKGRLGKCVASNEHFMAAFSLGEGTVRNALTALKSSGWVTWKTEDGRRELEALFPEIGKFPKSGFPKSGKKIPEIGNRLILEEIPLKNSSTPIVPTELELGITESKSRKQMMAEQAETIYQAYPLKVAKPPAIKSILKALKKVPADQLLRQVQNYATSVRGKDSNYLPHPATWFNQERWNDQPKTLNTTHDYRNASWAQPADPNDPGI